MRGLGRLLPLVAAAVGTALLIEVCVFLGVETGLLQGVQRPSYGAGTYWWGDHPEFGVWRHPNASFDHQSACFHVHYHTNSLGARDIERSRDAQKARVVLLGDSFLEGWGLDLQERLSNKLEEVSGLEHLNFAMSHFGPYQELLVYQSLASKFEHAGVIIGVTPTNDFVDLDLELSRGIADYEYRYRPYLVGDPSELHRFDYRESSWRRTLRRYSYAFNALLRAVSVWRDRGALPAASAEAVPFSWFYDYSAAQLRQLEVILSELARAAAPRPVVVMLIPVFSDLERFAHSGPDPLGARLAVLGAEKGFAVVDLLPDMANYNPRGRRQLFFSCDYHWSAYGNEVALRVALPSLYETLYEKLRPIPPR